MSKHLESFLTDVQTHMAASTGEERLTMNNDIVLLATDIGKHTEDFLVDNNLVAGDISMQDAPVVANENYGASNLGTTLGMENIETFVRSCGIPEEHVATAMETAGILLYKHLNSNNASGAWRSQSQKSSLDNTNMKAQDLNVIFPENIVSELDSWAAPSAESFGVNMDSALPDMKVALTVAMMRFHTSLTNRIMPTRPTPSPTVQYLKENIEVIDLSDTSAVAKKVVDLYADASLVSNKLTRIVPLAANDDDSVLVGDDVIKFAKKANLLELSIDSTKPGYTKINSTDTVADGASMSKVYVTLNDGTNTEQFLIELPPNTARFTRPSNARDAAIRTTDINYTALLLSTTKTSAGATSDVLSTLEAGEGIAVSLVIKASLNLKTGVVDALGSISITAHNTVSGQDASAAAELIVTQVNATALTADGYSMDAKHSEENLRKSNIQVKSQRQPFAFDIPTGRNYIYDYAIGQRNGDTNAAMLTKIISIGQDHKVLDLVTSTIDGIYNMVQANGSNPLEDGIDAGTDYVAGAKIRAYAYQDTLDLSSITTVSDSDRSGDIKQHVLTVLNAVCVKLCEESFITQQLPAGAKTTFKLITSGKLLGNLLGIPHTHNHLNDSGARSNGGVEYRIVLPSGIVLEVATTTFNSIEDKIILIPFIPNSPSSVLNFAHNWDYGTMVGNFTSSGDGNFNRLFANSRELPIVTDPIGAIIDVTNMSTAVFMTV